MLTVSAAAFAAVTWAVVFAFWALFLDALLNGGLL